MLTSNNDEIVSVPISNGHHVLKMFPDCNPCVFFSASAVSGSMTGGEAGAGKLKCFVGLHT